MMGVLIYIHDNFLYNLLDTYLCVEETIKFYQLSMWAFAIKFAELWTRNNLSINITQVKLIWFCT
jgi:hypothetical protein